MLGLRCQWIAHCTRDFPRSSPIWDRGALRCHGPGSADPAGLSLHHRRCFAVGLPDFEWLYVDLSRVARRPRYVGAESYKQANNRPTELSRTFRFPCCLAGYRSAHGCVSTTGCSHRSWCAADGWTSWWKCQRTPVTLLQLWPSQTLGWRHARALLEQLNTARPQGGIQILATATGG